MSDDSLWWLVIGIFVMVGLITLIHFGVDWVLAHPELLGGVV